MKSLVIDSSVIVKWLNQTKEQNLEQADKILQQARNNEVELLAPELAKYEVGNVLITKGVAYNEVEISLTMLYSFPITFIPESLDLAEQTYNIADRLEITYYDASFLSLAKQYDAILVTDNIKHQGRDSNIRVIALKDY
ncbi:MAG: type II toxin-antitoxin system VapC family toxin [Candidatus Levybacteria bacterium]|nr:type II toxin-antitoxin system VapC family toxin [Candidatus Levybacteria bacterium]